MIQAKKRSISTYLSNYCLKHDISQAEVQRVLEKAGIKYCRMGINYFFHGEIKVPANFLYAFYLKFNMNNELDLRDLFERARLMPEGICDSCLNKVIEYLAYIAECAHWRARKKNTRSTFTFKKFVKELYKNDV